MKRNVSRRAFLRTSAAAATAPVLGSCASLAGAAAWAHLPPGTLKVGLIGCGGRGTGAAYQALHAEEGSVVLWSVGDVFQDRVDGALEHLTGALAAREEDPENGVEALPDRSERLQVDESRRFVGFDAYEHVLASGADVVILATPPVFRPDHLRAVAEAGVHVFAEKPLAVDGYGVRSVLETSQVIRAKGLSAVVGLCWRYNVRHRAFYERLAALGDVTAFYSTYNAGPPATIAREPGMSEMEWQVRNWKNCQWLSGDHITEQAVHSLDKQAWTFGDMPPLSVTAIGGRQARGGPEHGNLFDHFSATFEYEGGAKAFHMARQIAGCDFDNSDHYFGTRGRGTINGWTPLHRIEGADGTPWEYEGEGNDMYQAEHDALFASIRAGTPIHDLEWGAKSTMLAVMTRLSAYSGRTVTWEQAMASEERMGLEHYALGAAPPLRPVAIPGQTPLV